MTERDFPLRNGISTATTNGKKSRQDVGFCEPFGESSTTLVLVRVTWWGQTPNRLRHILPGTCSYRKGEYPWPWGYTPGWYVTGPSAVM